MLFGNYYFDKTKKKLPLNFLLSIIAVIFYYKQLMIMKKTTTSKMKKSATARRTKTTYVPVSNNVYFDGSSYRVRASVNGSKISKNFSNKRTAITFRNQLLAA
jgi:hypothetical protein